MPDPLAHYESSTLVAGTRFNTKIIQGAGVCYISTVTTIVTLEILRKRLGLEKQ
ncbi:hypothetical protein IMZ38_01115 [Thermosphaera chiliense]|uniref:Uncharacterized protein n=1 Tax=Thermosphaera chiliense TaxID=3402707 RepID=A0A7M1URI2_9CREN|nr:hypothetical protein [Thermosphaera aggregans]QOR94569.1 hypothetical protein IMZ38_01115 [Thermosphaera aggregans]